MNYTKFNYREPPHENESWDQFLIRKLGEEREYNEKRKSLGND